MIKLLLPQFIFVLSFGLEVSAYVLEDSSLQLLL